MIFTLILAQLLLCGVAVQGVDFTAAGGYFIKGTNNYVVNENQTLSLTVTYKVTTGDTKVKWYDGSVQQQSTSSSYKQQSSYMEQLGLLGKVRSETLVKKVDRFSDIRWELDNWDNNFRVIVLYPIAPQIELVDKTKVGKMNNGDYYIYEGQTFSLVCTGGGMENVTLKWLQDPGDVLRVKLNSEVSKNWRTERYLPMGSTTVSVSATYGMTSIGCRADSKFYEGPMFDSFNIINLPHPKISIDVDDSTCNQLTLTCSSDAVEDDEVDLLIVKLNIRLK